MKNGLLICMYMADMASGRQLRQISPFLNPSPLQNSQQPPGLPISLTPPLATLPLPFHPETTQEDDYNNDFEYEEEEEDEDYYEVKAKRIGNVFVTRHTIFVPNEDKYGSPIKPFTIFVIPLLLLGGFNLMITQVFDWTYNTLNGNFLETWNVSRRSLPLLQYSATTGRDNKSCFRFVRCKVVNLLTDAVSHYLNIGKNVNETEIIKTWRQAIFPESNCAQFPCHAFKD